MVVLTSDHGMELKDSSRRGSTTDRLSAEGIRFVKVGNNLVFKRLAVEVEGGDDLTPGEPAQILLTVLDRHTVDGPERVPIAGATVRVISGAEEVSAVTDASGTLEMELRPAQGAQAVELLVEHADYNAEALELSLQ